MKTERGLKQHIRQSEYCFNLKQEKERRATNRDDSTPRHNDQGQKRDRSHHLDMEDDDTCMDNDEPEPQIGRILHVDSLERWTTSSRSEIQMPLVDRRQEENDSMKWLPYRRVLGDDDYAMFGANNDDSSDENEDQKMAAEVSSASDISERKGDESSESSSDEDDIGGEDMTEEERQEWQNRRRLTVEAFKAYVTFSEQHLIPLEKNVAQAVKIMHKLIKKRHLWILTKLSCSGICERVDSWQSMKILETVHSTFQGKN